MREERGGGGKKTAETALEIEGEISRLLEKAAKAKKIDLEAIETALRAAVLMSGARLLAKLIEGVGRGRRAEALTCACGARMVSRGVVKKTVLTILGPVTFRRSRYECPVCEAVRYPGDEALDVVGTSRSPGVRRMMARAGSRQTFKESREDLKIYAGLKVSAKDVERVAEQIGQEMETWQTQERKELLAAEVPLKVKKTIPVLYIEMDGTGVPMVKEAVAGRKGKQADGTARTREVKLGCVFTQSQTDGKGRPVRDSDSTSFVGAIETAEDFGVRLEAEALRRGLYEAEKVVLLGDGATWIRGLAELRFPNAQQIIDLYHAREHVADLAKLLWGADDKKITRQRIRWWTYLDEGQVEKIIKEARKNLPSDKEARKKIESRLHYLEDNKARMRYADFRKQGLFVGSGVVEAGCKSIVAARLKQSGMEWSLRGANAIISLRCNILSGRLEQFWEDRAA